ncbi:pyridoxamine 5'-phosphate oxidase family protein [Cellulomonas sp. NPDC089187]|uniref:pyridoxamine 5'-phosphate oxidase family protein n=1 Tax=Cellulomonas sp. NPDC089187 TaxID=3154970 RepID=UPI003438C084
MTHDDAWSEIADARLVALTTYRKDGTSVSTPVWIAPESSALVVISDAATRKAKRLRHDPRLRLRSSERWGRSGRWW